jgi:excisionase family DNA binding protein
MLENIIGVEEASKLLKLSPGYIKNLCAANKLPAKKIGKTWVIDKTKLEENRMVTAERVLELIKAHLKVSAGEGTAHLGYTKEENSVIREFAQTVLEDLESYENGYED